MLRVGSPEACIQVAGIEDNLVYRCQILSCGTMAGTWRTRRPWPRTTLCPSQCPRLWPCPVTEQKAVYNGVRGCGYTSRSEEWTRRSSSAVSGCMSVNVGACKIVRCGLVNGSSGPGRIWFPLSDDMRTTAEIHWRVGTIGMAVRRSSKGPVVRVA